MAESTAISLFDNRLWRWWRRKVVTGVDHDAVIRRVNEEARWSSRFAFMIVIAAGISILGLLLPSPTVLIGAMLMSPLMMPVIGLGFALATFDFDEVRRALFALAAGSLIAILLSIVCVSISPLQTVTSEIAIRTKPNLFDLLVALLSALAGSYALIRGRGETVVGVAIAIALMPPLVVVGFGIATGNWTVFGGALLLFFTNFITIALTAAFVARIYGFGSHLSPGQTRLQMGLIIAIMFALALPLALTLRQIAWESLASRQIRDAVIAPFPRQARMSQIEIDFDRAPIRVRAAVMTPSLVARADANALAKAGDALGLPLDLHIDQIPVGAEARAGETAQLAAAQGGQRQGATSDAMRDRIALLTGSKPEDVLLDTQSRTILARFAPLPDATIATYHSIEQRAAALMNGWDVRMTPPATALSPVDFEGDTPDPALLADAIWAGQRLNLPIGVSGRGVRADAVVAALEEAGVTAERVAGSGSANGVALRWRAPVS